MKKRMLCCSFLLAGCFLMLNTGCEEDVPIPKKNYLKDVVVRSQASADIGAYAIISGNTIQAKVPFDGTNETRFKVDLVFPEGIGNISVAPESGGIYNFTSPQQFAVKYANGEEQIYVMNLERDTLDMPRMTRFELRFVTPEISYANPTTGDRFMRFKEGTNLTAVEPWIHFNKPTVRQISPSKTVDFSQGPVVYQLQNGNQTRYYTVTLSDYGYGRHQPVSNFTEENNGNRLERLTDSEGSIAFDNTGSYLYVANGDVLHRYACTGARSQTPTALNVTDGVAFVPAHVESAYMTINETLQWGFYGCNAIENGGIFKIYYWAAVTSAPAIVAEIDLTAEGATVDCFSWKVVNNRVCAYLVDKAPMLKAIPENPKIYIIRDLASFNKVRSYEKVELTGAIEMGAVAAPKTMLSPIDGTNDFILTGGASSPIYIRYNTASTPLSATVKFPETSLLPKTITGMRTFSFVRGKYMAWVEYSLTDTPQSSAFLTILDVSKQGFQAAINDIIAEGNAHTTLNKCTRFRIPLGKTGNPEMLGDVTLFPVGTRMRVAGSVGGNGIYAFEWE